MPIALGTGLVAISREARCEARRESNWRFFEAFVLLVVLLVEIFGKSRFLVTLGCSEVIKSTKLC